MKKISKQQSEEKDTLVASLRDTESNINQMIEEANEIIQKINEEKAKLQSVMSEVESWRDEVTTEIESYMEDRSEKWQESEAAERYNEWKTQFDDIPLEYSGEIELIEEISVGEETASYLEENISSSLDNV
jgi:uncharacterized coiled-coil DUF342 family protein